MYYIDLDAKPPVFYSDEIFVSIPTQTIEDTASANSCSLKDAFYDTLKLNKEDGEFLLEKYCNKILELAHDAAFWLKREEAIRPEIPHPPLTLEGFSYADLITKLVKANEPLTKTLLHKTYRKLVSERIMEANSRLNLMTL